MILYHGSNVIVEKPALLPRQVRSLDFGPGFYTTINRDCYGALHTTGEQYTIEDIDEFIASRQIS
jgi:hypothetical protein